MHAWTAHPGYTEMIAARYMAAPTVGSTTMDTLFQRPFTGEGNIAGYDVSRDAQRFLLVARDQPEQLVVDLSFAARLQRARGTAR